MILLFLALVIVFNLLLAFLVLQRRPNKLDSIYFLLMVISMALWAIGVYFANPAYGLDFSLWMVRLAYFGSYGILFGLFFFALYLVNDRKSVIFRLRRQITLLGGVISLIAFTPFVVPYVVVADHGGVDEGFGILKVPFLIVLVLLFVATFIVLLRYIRHASTPPQVRAQLRLILVGVIVSFVIGFVLNAVIPAITGSYELASFGPLSVSFLAIAVAIAIVKHRLFDVRLVVARSLAYIFALIVLVCVYVFLAFGITASIFNNQPSVSQQSVYALLAVVTAITFTPLKKRFDKVTRTVFYRDGYDTQEVLDDVGSELVKTTSVEGLGHEVLMILQKALKSSNIAIFIEQDKESRVVRLNDSSFHEGVVFSKMKPPKTNLMVTDELEENLKLASHLKSEDIAVVVPLRTSKEVIGYLLFSYKNSGNIYNDQDIRLIKIVSDQLAVAIQNALRFEEIQQFNETLQDKVDAATGRLRKANERLKQLDATKDEFVSMASHQLRTPLTSVKGYLSMVLEGDAGKLNPTQDKLLREAFTSSERMVRLIGDFLNVSRLRTGKFMVDRKPVNMADLVEGEVSQLKPTADARELKLTYEKPKDFPEVGLDKNKIQQVVMNFIDNAIFYSKPKGKITVELYKKQNDIIFKVKDEGIGVPASEKKRLFTKFFRASNARKQRPDGTGIGLFMAQKVVIAHGGSVIFESKEGEGSTFGFQIPIELSEADKERAAQVTSEME